MLVKKSAGVSTVLMLACEARLNRAVTGSVQVDRQTGRQTGRQTDRQADRQAGRQTDRQAGRQTDRQTDRQAGRQTGRQRDRQTGRQAGRQAGRLRLRLINTCDSVRLCGPAAVCHPNRTSNTPSPDSINKCGDFKSR